MESTESRIRREEAEKDHALAEQARWEMDYEARIKEAREAGFVEGAKVRRAHDGPDSEIGEVIDLSENSRAMVIRVRFGEDEFPYTMKDLELVK